MISLVANHLWQSTVFALAAALLALALKQNQARTRHAIWLAASVKFLVPFALLVAAGNQLQWHSRRQAACTPIYRDRTDQPALPIAAARASCLSIAAAKQRG